MDLDRESLAAMTADIWSSMLGLELQAGNGAMASLGTTRTLTGCVHITGDWRGAVTLRCPTAVARRFAALMFSDDEASLGMDDVRDALGELTNMTGGTVKGMLAGDCQLGIPTVAEGLDYTLAVPRATAILEMGYEVEGQPVEVVVYKVA